MKNWRKYNGAIIPLTPPHIKVDTNGIEDEIKSKDVFFARWTSDFDCKNETEFWYVIQDAPMEIEEYSKNTRNQIRRGLRNCIVKLVTVDEVIELGFESYSEAFSNYNTHLTSKLESDFSFELLNLNGNWDFWGIFHENKMIGYSQNRVIDDYCDYSSIKFHPQYLKLYPSYALFYTMNQYYLNDNNFKYVNDGARSISHDTNIQSFLIDKFKFRKAYCKLNIIYSSKIRLFISMFYPFNKILNLLNFKLFMKINVLLFQEKIRRSYER